MTKPITILVVEDEMIIGAKISLLLTKLGYEVTGIVPKGEEAILHIQQNAPDIVLLDIHLRGQMDGIDTAREILKEGHKTVLIYLTANTDEETFNRAKQTRPFAFLSKPIQPQELQRTIELTVERILVQREVNLQETKPLPQETDEELMLLQDRIFVSSKNKLVKIFINDILYLVAERSYCQIFTKNQQFVLSVPLKSVEHKLQTAQFLRVHRSYLVNIKAIDEISQNYVFINKKAIPMVETAKEELFKRLNKV
ncbi:LytTR family DNA-binding domain-containing protein [Jiulongibacter sediminis]|uniref:LytR/AlgR family response regulator transcription factor n=1 Tax=Jiulongibacter sediminis TaxID=1605367 RepID=UPI0026EE7045|nr:response regulator [Jiulongibacter sediminis]